MEGKDSECVGVNATLNQWPCMKEKKKYPAFSYSMFTFTFPCFHSVHTFEIHAVKEQLGAKAARSGVTI